MTTYINITSYVYFIDINENAGGSYGFKVLSESLLENNSLKRLVLWDGLMCMWR